MRKNVNDSFKAHVNVLSLGCSIHTENTELFKRQGIYYHSDLKPVLQVLLLSKGANLYIYLSEQNYNFDNAKLLKNWNLPTIAKNELRVLNLLPAQLQTTLMRSKNHNQMEANPFIFSVVSPDDQHIFETPVKGLSYG